MEKSIYYLDYNKETKQATFIGIVKNSEHSIQLELNESEYKNIMDNLDFVFIKYGKPVIDETFKSKFQSKIIALNRIQELKQLLASTDWKVIVNAELIQVGLNLKYPELHAERQAWRDEINELENE
jgi:hypothetical protein